MNGDFLLQFRENAVIQIRISDDERCGLGSGCVEDLDEVIDEAIHAIQDALRLLGGKCSHIENAGGWRALPE